MQSIKFLLQQWFQAFAQGSTKTLRLKHLNSETVSAFLICCPCVQIRAVNNYLSTYFCHSMFRPNTNNILGGDICFLSFTTKTPGLSFCNMVGVSYFRLLIALVSHFLQKLMWLKTVLGKCSDFHCKTQDLLKSSYAGQRLTPKIYEVTTVFIDVQCTLLLCVESILY